MSELYMTAYYYSFDHTGCREVDEILSAVACAGKAFHHTEDWNLDAYGEGPPVKCIQEAAKRAAKHIEQLLEENRRLKDSILDATAP